MNSVNTSKIFNFCSGIKDKVAIIEMAMYDLGTDCETSERQRHIINCGQHCD